MTRPEDATPAAMPDSVATGRSGKTPFIALGATVVIIAVPFVIALGLAELAYWLAG